MPAHGGDEWTVLPSVDAVPGTSFSDDTMRATDLAKCRAICASRGFGGFVVYRGVCYFRDAPSDELLDIAMQKSGCFLHVRNPGRKRQDLFNSDVETRQLTSPSLQANSRGKTWCQLRARVLQGMPPRLEARAAQLGLLRRLRLDPCRGVEYNEVTGCLGGLFISLDQIRQRLQQLKAQMAALEPERRTSSGVPLAEAGKALRATLEAVERLQDTALKWKGFVQDQVLVEESTAAAAGGGTPLLPAISFSELADFFEDSLATEDSVARRAQLLTCLARCAVEDAQGLPAAGSAAADASHAASVAVSPERPAHAWSPAPEDEEAPRLQTPPPPEAPGGLLSFTPPPRRAAEAAAEQLAAREVATAASLLAASADAPSGALRASVVPMKVLRELVGPAGSASAEPLRAASAARRALGCVRRACEAGAAAARVPGGRACPEEGDAAAAELREEALALAALLESRCAPEAEVCGLASRGALVVGATYSATSRLRLCREESWDGPALCEVPEASLCRVLAHGCKGGALVSFDGDACHVGAVGWANCRPDARSLPLTREWRCEEYLRPVRAPLANQPRPPSDPGQKASLADQLFGKRRPGSWMTW